MELHKMPRAVSKRKKRVGRGGASGKGKTSGRGTKGQKARGKVRGDFEGGQTRLIKRLPLRRGTHNLKVFKKPLVVNLEYLGVLAKGTVVDLETLIKARIVDERQARSFGIKILGKGEIKMPLTIALPISNSARLKIEKAGGKVKGTEEEIDKTPEVKVTERQIQKKKPKAPIKETPAVPKGPKAKISRKKVK